jgi:hypothetical protein
MSAIPDDLKRTFQQLIDSLLKSVTSSNITAASDRRQDAGDEGLRSSR